jgi:hypothetical protein
MPVRSLRSGRVGILSVATLPKKRLERSRASFFASAKSFFKNLLLYLKELLAVRHCPLLRIIQNIARKPRIRLGQGIGEAVPEIQTRRMTAALAEIAVGFAGNPGLGLSITVLPRVALASVFLGRLDRSHK